MKAYSTIYLNGWSITPIICKEGIGVEAVKVEETNLPFHISVQPLFGTDRYVSRDCVDITTDVYRLRVKRSENKDSVNVSLDLLV